MTAVFVFGLVMAVLFCAAAFLGVLLEWEQRS